MSKLDHPNVMKLIGVCIDTVDVPYILMPYMCYGSLLSYLKKHRVELTITNDDNQELVRTCIDYHKLAIHELWLYLRKHVYTCNVFSSYLLTTCHYMSCYLLGCLVILLPQRCPSIYFFLDRLPHLKRSYFQCVFKSQRGWNIWQISSLYTETWQHETACKRHMYVHTYMYTVHCIWHVVTIS